MIRKLALFAFLFAFSSYALPAQTIWLYQVDLHSTWNNSTSVWDSTARSSNVYHPGLGLVTNRSTEKYDGGWNLSDRFLSSYNADGNSTSFSQEYLENGQWFPSYQQFRSYNPQGLLEVEYTLDTSSGALDTTLRKRFYYDAQDRKVEETFENYDPGTATWEWEADLFYTYGTGQGWEEYLQLNWNNGAWDSTRRRLNITWHDFEKFQLGGYVEELYINSNWRPSGKQHYDWDNNGGYAIYLLSYNMTTMGFDSASLNTLTRDARSNLLLTEKYNYVDGTGWDFSNATMRLNSYDASDRLVEVITQTRNWSQPVFENKFRAEYYDFVVDVEGEMSQVSFAQWAPHPVGQTGNLRVSAEKPGTLVVQVMDVNGRLLRQVTQPVGVGTENISVDLGLAPGLYLYHVTLNGAFSTGRLLVN